MYVVYARMENIESCHSTSRTLVEPYRSLCSIQTENLHLSLISRLQPTKGFSKGKVFPVVWSFVLLIGFGAYKNNMNNNIQRNSIIIFLIIIWHQSKTRLIYSIYLERFMFFGFPYSRNHFIWRNVECRAFLKTNKWIRINIIETPPKKKQQTEMNR